MSHQEKVAHWIADLRMRGIEENTAIPPIWRLAWKLGLELPPPHFMAFIPLALVIGIPFGFLWGLVMWLVLWSNLGLGFSASAGAAAGTLFGLPMAAYFRFQAGKHHLGSWESYPGHG